MRLHLLGLPHTVTAAEFSHCAYTGKVLKMPAMLATLPGQPYEVIHYGVEGAEVACEHVDLMGRAEQVKLLGGEREATAFVGDAASTSSPLYREFNRRLRGALRDRVALNDLVLLPFGHAHKAALDGLPYTLVESGIGYPTLYPGDTHRVFESYAWMHWHQGRANRQGKSYEWVVPNYFDVAEWDFDADGDPDTVVYFGRINDLKGLPTVVEVARRRPDLRFVICGQGDPAPYLVTPNIEYRPPISGRERSDLLGRARAVLMPTAYTEPFGGVAVEAMLTGTPVLASPWGAFTETIEDGVTGFLCHTLGDWLAGLERAVDLDRHYIRDRAAALYGFERVARMYDRVFRQITDLQGEGWYSTTSTLARPGDAWARAQAQERAYHLRPERRADERRKRARYARDMGIDADAVRGLRVIDIGCGPESLLLDHPGVEGTALDPLRFTDADEARYEAAGIARIVAPAEDGLRGAGEFDEAWIYNVLQHVKDPEAVLAQAREHARVVRVWEYCGVPTDAMHLHTLTADGIRSAMEGWEVLRERSGTLTGQDGCSGDYYAAVFGRPEMG